MTFDYDLFVIGGGSGGVRAARVAAGETGAKVALAEEDRYGGTCVIRGCVPKKLMVFASEFSHLSANAAGYGWNIPQGTFDWTAFRTRLDAELDRLEGIYRRLLNTAGVETFDTRATLVDAHTVRFANGDTRTAKHILVATGGHPTLPDIDGKELAITSNDIFHLESLPETMLIVGGGFIACEFACILAGMGVKVTQFYRGDQILRGFDDEARNLLAHEMRRKGVDLQVNINVTGIEQDGDAVRVTDTNGDTRTFGKVLFATGRAPNTAGLGLVELGVELKPGGAIAVDDYSQTAVPSIYAIGDVTDRVNLTPVAIREGMAFVDTVFRGRPTPVDHDLIPSAVYTQPELGTIGITEEQLSEPAEIYSTTFRPMQTAFIGSEDRVLMKLIVSKETRRVLGCHIVAPNAGELIQMAGIAIKMGATKEDFDRTVAVHPTISEEIVTMRTAVRSV